MGRKNTTCALFSAELPSERVARKLAQRIANRLAQSSKAGRWEAIVVTDEHGDMIYEVAVPLRH